MLQLDIIVSFVIDEGLSESISQDDSEYDCSTSGGAVNRGALGPFGILVLADGALSELTPIYFYLDKGANGKVVTHFCADELRSVPLFRPDAYVVFLKILICEAVLKFVRKILTQLLSHCLSDFSLLEMLTKDSKCRSSEAPDVEETVYGSKVPVLDGEKLSMRTLVCNELTIIPI